MLTRIRKADIPELSELAEGIRKRIIEVVSENGGHLAPSLGVVELTVALHHVFDSPRDSIIWDVGHQSYAHKIITGRDEQFSTLRTTDGLAGFPKRCESEHDPFGTGHSSTSISAALGIAEAKRMGGETGKTIAVIGDGSLTAGLAYEGLNNAGHVQNKRLIVIFNDNQMSIDRNVGALAKFMNKGLTSPTYNRIRRDFKTLAKIFSTEGLNLAELSKRAATVVKDFFLAGSLFEAFGFRYIGPIDGHDMPSLVSNLEKIVLNIDEEEDRARPILLHVITKKGKGYHPAEQDPSRFHGIGSFNLSDGKVVKGKPSAAPTYTAVFGETVCDLMKLDNRIVAITAAMPSGTGLDLARDRFPGRYFDVGIAEQHAVVFAAGLAARGFRPIVAIYSSFLQRAYDAIVHDVCLQNLPVIFAVDRAGVVGEDGPTHHGVFDLSFLRHIPNLAVASPKDEEELRRMLWSAVDYGGPIALRYPRGKALGASLTEERSAIPFGKAEMVSDCADARYSIFAIGNMVDAAKKAAAILKDENVPTAVINARFAKPLDESCLLREIAQDRSIITVEDNALSGGFGSGVIELLNAKSYTDVSVTRIGYPDSFVEHGGVATLHERYGLTPERIAQRIVEINRTRTKGDGARDADSSHSGWPRLASWGDR